MSIFIDEKTRVLVLGITGREGSFWTGHMKEMGTDIRAGVTPGKGGRSVEGIPVYDTVSRALAGHEVDAALLFVPPRATREAVEELLEAGLRKIVTVSEGVPLHETLAIRRAARARGAMVIGGNTSGAISPGQAMMGIFPYWIERVYRPGRIGVMTRSGSLTNEVTAMAVAAGFGVSTLVGVGGDAVPGTRFGELLPLFEADAETDAVLLIGEIGGSMEEEAADSKASGAFTKPLVAFLAGRWAPEGVRMGHAGAIVSGGAGSVKHKIERLHAAGAAVAERPAQVGDLLIKAMGGP
jgi:succinyl-CoA synthetase alpha subunit